MPPAPKRMYRIESYYQSQSKDEQPKDHVLAEVRHREMMAAIADLKKTMLANASTDGPAAAPAPAISEELLHDLVEAKKIQSELKELHETIESTKREILSLHTQSTDGKEISRVSEELDAIIKGTEDATENILTAAENIDTHASHLVAAIKDETQSNEASDIQDNVIKIFEACNFQDLTGQRISKVVKAFSYVDERITQLLEIWGGIDSFNHIEVIERDGLHEDADLLNGPALEEDIVASQGDIDAMFD